MFKEKKRENKSPLEIREVTASPISMDSRSPAKIITGKADVDLSLLSKATKDRVLMNQLVPSIFIVKKHE